MEQKSQDELLQQLRRHQRSLITGGGWLITIVVVLACVLEIWASTREYLGKVQEEVSADVRRVSELSARTVATLRNNVQNIEISLKDSSPVDQQMLQQYREGQASLKVQKTDTYPVLVVGNQATLNEPGAWDYIRLAQAMSPALSVIVDRNSGELSSYLLSADQDYLLLAVAPWPGDEWQKHWVKQRGQLIPLLSRGMEHVDEVPGQRAVPMLRWLAPRESVLTGKLAIPITTSLLGSSGGKFGSLFFELPVEVFLSELVDINFGGDCLIFDKTEQAILSCGDSVDEKLLPVAVKAMQGGLGLTQRRSFADGRFLFAWSLGQSGWTLVYAQSWFDIVVGILPQLSISLLAATVIVMLTWGLLLLLQSRVLRPAVERSAQVFESEQLSRTIIATVPVGLALLSRRDGQAMLCSPEMLHMQQKVLVDENGGLLDILMRQFHRNDASTLCAGEVEATRHGVTLTTIDGEAVSLSVSVVPVRYRGSDALVTSFVNITDQKKLEQGLLDAKEAADKANAAKSSFLAAMSHEIRTPLNAIVGNLELLAYSAMDSQRARLDTIQRASDNLLAIISDILDFSKIEAGELRLEEVEFDALEVAANALDIFAPIAAAKGITLSGELGDTVTKPIHGDPTRLGQVLNNLLSNALKFTDQGEVTLRVVSGVPDLQVEIQDTGIGMSSDQIEHAFRAFSQADETINRRFGGTGLGLTLCMRLIQAMGGELSVHSKLGEGSTFHVCIPSAKTALNPERPRFEGERVLVIASRPQWQRYLYAVLSSWNLKVDLFQHPAQLDEKSLSSADAMVLWGDRLTWHLVDEQRVVDESSWVVDCAPEGARVPVLTGHVLHGSCHGLSSLSFALRHVLQGAPLPVHKSERMLLLGHLRVLVAEDNVVNRRLFEEQLSLLGCQVDPVVDGHQALEHLAQKPYDVLITDLSMPGMDGYELACQVRERWPRMPVVAATANATLQEKEQCEGVGIARVLSKPLSLAALERVLREVCDVPAGQTFVPNDCGASLDDSWLAGQALPADVRSIFEQTCLKSAAVIRQACEAQNAESILAELHSLRGALSVFRMQVLMEQASEVELLVRAEGVKSACASAMQFCENVEQIGFDSPSGERELVARILQLSKAQYDDKSMQEIQRLAQALQLVSVKRESKISGSSPKIFK